MQDKLLGGHPCTALWSGIKCTDHISIDANCSLRWFQRLLQHLLQVQYILCYLCLWLHLAKRYARHRPHQDFNLPCQVHVLTAMCVCCLALKHQEVSMLRNITCVRLYCKRTKSHQQSSWSSKKAGAVYSGQFSYWGQHWGSSTR